jgi:predicted small secreted protein
MTRNLLLALAAMAALAACNTVGGAGEDLSKAGKAVTNQADETEQQM